MIHNPLIEVTYVVIFTNYLLLDWYHLHRWHHRWWIPSSLSGKQQQQQQAEKITRFPLCNYLDLEIPFPFKLQSPPASSITRHVTPLGRSSTWNTWVPSPLVKYPLVGYSSPLFPYKCMGGYVQRLPGTPPSHRIIFFFSFFFLLISLWTQYHLNFSWYIGFIHLPSHFFLIGHSHKTQIPGKAISDSAGSDKSIFLSSITSKCYWLENIYLYLFFGVSIWKLTAVVKINKLNYHCIGPCSLFFLSYTHYIYNSSTFSTILIMCLLSKWILQCVRMQDICLSNYN